MLVYRRETAQGAGTVEILSAVAQLYGIFVNDVYE